MAPTLLVLAAGMGSRYGGLKQMDAVGPSGETVLDYGVHDAICAGFGRVVFVIRRDFEGAFRASVIAKYEKRIQVDLVFQSTDDLPAGFKVPADRVKPLGTGHAVWCARNAVNGPFAVINADDFYGASSYAKLAGFLSGAGPRRFAIVGFHLANTLSESGSVSRGICEERGGKLASITEVRSITRNDVGAGRRFTGRELVSMNLWGFTPEVFAGLEAGLVDFLKGLSSAPGAEFYLPAAVSSMIGSGAATVDVIESDSAWFGITYREDKPLVEQAVAELVRTGAYPARLFGAA
jgi:NDP-sugar pyrophosphorylase family protein